MKKNKHEIIKRTKEFIDHDTIGYCASCSCGELFTGWSESEAETKATEHIKSYGSDRAPRNVDKKSNL